MEKSPSNFNMNSLQFTSTGGLRVIYILVTICLIVAAVASDDYKEEIPGAEPYLKENADDNIENMIMLSDDELGESYILSEENEYEEIEFQSGEFIEFDSETNLKADLKAAHKFRDVALKRYKDDFSPKSSIKKRRLHKRAATSCSPTTSPITCDATAKYRTQDGTCNNLNNPEWGMANGCQERLLPADYTGTSGFRTSADGGPLPGPRNLSLCIFQDKNRPTKLHNHLYMFMGQFFTHGTVLTATPVTSTGAPIDCCDPSLQDNVWCSAAIKISSCDPFFSKFGVNCSNFQRAASCTSCVQKNRYILTLVTSYIDASQVYGSSENVSMSLRAYNGTGQLISQPSPYGSLLPNSSDPAADGCSVPAEDRICFQAGDVRVNQHTTLTCIQTCFLRLHNLIAEILKILNPHWDDETIFQEARRIVGAILQNIIYNEYLPATFNNDTMSKYQLAVPPGYSTYDPNIHLSILLEWSAGAFRTFHSMVNTNVTKETPLNVTEGYREFRNTYSRPFGLRKGSCGPLIVDTTSTPAQMVDRYAVKDITDYLYRAPGQPYGGDLAATDIDRGRDDGLPTYIAMLKYCTGITILDFDDLSEYGVMTPENVCVLKSNYKNVSDVDLEPGLVMEIAEENSVLGPTANCIIAIQFHRLKFGDRFYFTHANQTGSFTPGQLSELKKMTLTMVFCLTLDITALPANAFFFASESNPMVNCSSFQGQGLNFTEWKE